MSEFLEKVGTRVSTGVNNAGYTMRLCVDQFLNIDAFFSKFGEVLKQMYLAGVQSMSVTFIVALFIGMVLALQTGLTLRPFGMEGLVAQIAGVAMVREMGPLMTAIILAGRVGSSMAAELGTMKVSEEIDALEIMSINPIRYLIVPKVAALTIMCPLLTIYCNLIGICGSAIVAQTQIGVPMEQFFRDSFDIIQYRDLFSGLAKAMVFGFLVSVISCSEGMRTTGGAQGVGRSTRNAVVTSLLSVIVANYIMTTFIQRMFYMG